MRLLRRGAALCAGLFPALLAGAFFVFTLAKVEDPQASAGGSLVVGALCGVVVAGMVRLFRIAPFGYPFAGLVCGPVPFLLLAGGEDPPPDEGGRAAVWLVAALFGALVGILEWARARRS